jgi:hypothetical protein
MNFKIPAWAAIFAAVVMVPFSILAFIPINSSVVLSNPYLIILNYAYFFLYSIVVIGLLQISIKEKNNFLKTTLIIALVIFFLMYLKEFIFTKSTLLSALSLVFGGIISIIAGSALLTLKKHKTKVLIAIGIIYIIEGFFDATLLFALYTQFLCVAELILEAIFFFKIKNIKK